VPAGGVGWQAGKMTQYKYTFEARDYIKFMPYDATDQFAGRRHICPICNQKVWSCYGNADKHWQRHGQERMIND